jgi:hypothetical protein
LSNKGQKQDELAILKGLKRLFDVVSRAEKSYIIAMTTSPTKRGLRMSEFHIEFGQWRSAVHHRLSAA